MAEVGCDVVVVDYVVADPDVVVEQQPREQIMPSVSVVAAFHHDELVVVVAMTGCDDSLRCNAFPALHWMRLWRPSYGAVGAHRC